MNIIDFDNWVAHIEKGDPELYLPLARDGQLRLGYEVFVKFAEVVESFLPGYTARHFSLETYHTVCALTQRQRYAVLTDDVREHLDPSRWEDLFVALVRTAQGLKEKDAPEDALRTTAREQMHALGLRPLH